MKKIIAIIQNRIDKKALIYGLFCFIRLKTMKYFIGSVLDETTFS